MQVGASLIYIINMMCYAVSETLHFKKKDIYQQVKIMAKDVISTDICSKNYLGTKRKLC